MSKAGTTAPPLEPSPDCALCARLQSFRTANRLAQPDWHNAPVPSFGASDARLLVVGLAPGLKGANRTGRPFTGDYAGDLLYATLLETGFARGTYGATPSDGLQLVDCRITNAVRCVPPENKPTPAEITTCRPYLRATIDGMPRLSAILALGRVAHDSVLTTFAAKKTKLPFGHGKVYMLNSKITLFSSYHCSRYNTNTGVLTPKMFQDVANAIKIHLSDMAS
ncbi:MAG: uracil-DNA glycosylase [Hyphomicrobiaceae bacterium]